MSFKSNKEIFDWLENYVVLAQNKKDISFSDIVKFDLFPKHNERNIYLIVGKSGAGKSSIVQQFIDLVDKYAKAQWKELKSYTTRPQRNATDNTHTFINQAKFNNFVLNNKLVARTKFNGYDYGATKEQIDESDFYVIDTKGIKQFVENYSGDKRIIIFNIQASPWKRFKRMVKRGDSVFQAFKRLWHDHWAFRDLYEVAGDKEIITVNANKSLDTTIKSFALKLMLDYVWEFDIMGGDIDE